MHELSLAHSAVALIDETARRDHFSRVRVVRLEIGELSCVEPEALRVAFDAASVGTCVEGASLVVIPVPGLGECPGCGVRSPMATSPDLCPNCARYPLTVITGTQMRVKDLDVE